MSELKNHNCLYTIKAMYLGSEPMGELLDGQNGSDAIQIPLKKKPYSTHRCSWRRSRTEHDQRISADYIRKRNESTHRVAY